MKILSRAYEISFVVTKLVTPATLLAVCQSTGAIFEGRYGNLPVVRVIWPYYRGKLQVSYW